MKKIDKIENLIIQTIKKLLKNKPKGHHDPIFVGNEKKYLNRCISSGYVSYVGKYVKVFEKKISSYTNEKKIGIKSNLKLSYKDIGTSINCSGVCLTLEKIHHKLYFFYLQKKL